MPPSHVLVALDGSPRAEAALERALGRFDCRVTVLNVLTPIDAGMSEGRLLGPDETRRREARERAQRLAAAAPGTAATVEPVVTADEPAEAISAYVADHDVDRVVLGGHGGPRHEVAERLLGTVAATVSDRTNVPVTVVREPAE